MPKTILTAVIAALVGAAFALALSDRSPRANATWDSGIAVRGHWRIEVRDPDGTLVERREFDNAFVDSDNLGAELLAGTASQGWLGIMISGGDQPCRIDGGSAQDPCRILPAGAMHVHADSTVFANLETTVTDHEITLKGHMIAGKDGNIGSVATIMSTCGADVAPGTCAVSVMPADSGVFTSHSLGDLLDVLKDQQVIAEVTLQLSPAH